MKVLHTKHSGGEFYQQVHEVSHNNVVRLYVEINAIADGERILPDGVVFNSYGIFVTLPDRIESYVVI